MLNITGIRFRKHGAKTVRGWRLSAGIGKLRPVVAFHGDSIELETVARAIVFALAGKRHADLAEVWLDAADDAGDVWTIERGTKGTLFRKNNRLLSIEEAQGSLLASLLDLDASLNQSEVLVAPVELRQIITRGADVAATVWDPNGRDVRGEVPAIIAARDLAHRCAEITGHLQYADEKRLSRIAGPSARLLGALEELDRQAEQLGAVNHDEAKLDAGLEVIQSEIDVLNQIDQLLRRINEGGESFARLSSMLESYDARLLEIETKWSKETLTAVSRHGEATRLIEHLVRLRACTKFSENLGRIKVVMDDQVRPVSTEGLKVWNDYISGARSDGQEIESCLASMLLGIKQMAQEVDRYVSQAPSTPRLTGRTATNWFEKLKTGSTRMVDERFKDATSALQLQRDWIAGLARDVDTVKVATEYALRASQNLSDKANDAGERLHKEVTTIATLSTRVASECERLRGEWHAMAKEFAIPDAFGIEQLAGLIRDANEHLIIRDTRQDLAVRVEDRRAVQATLEAAVRQWWEIIGSQKSTDLSNLSFLIGEAKGALRYREGRRQRIQKGLDDTARRHGERAAAAWVAGRREEIGKEWAKLFGSVDLPVLEINGDRTRELVDMAHRCAALLDTARIEEQDRFAAAALWPSRLDSAVLIYRWMEERVPPTQRTSFLKSLGSFTGGGEVPVVLLILDPELAKALAKQGTGSATSVEIDDIAAIEGPRREGAVVKAELKGRRSVQSPPATELPANLDPAPNAPRSHEILSRAEAALRILNPKATR